jgi:hypothetical protein
MMVSWIALWGAVVYVAVKQANRPPSDARGQHERPFVGSFARAVAGGCVVYLKNEGSTAAMRPLGGRSQWSEPRLVDTV